MPRHIFARLFPQALVYQIARKRCQIRVMAGQIWIEVSHTYQLADLLEEINAANCHPEIDMGAAVGHELL